MAKANTSKKKKKVRPTGKFVEFWKSERGRKLRGACYILLALFLTVATFSFFISWPSQSTWLGRLGYHLANALVQDTFGIASLGFSFLLFLYGLRLWKVNLMPWWRTFWVTLFWMLWISTVLGYLNGRFFKSETFSNYVGITGKFVSEQLYLLIRWGVVILLIFVAVVVLIFIHRVRFKMPKMPDVNLPKVNLKEKINNLKAKEQEEKEEE